MDKATEKVVKDADGNEVTAETTFVAKESNGSVKVTFTFDGSKLAGKTVVAFEDIYQNGKLYASMQTSMMKDRPSIFQRSEQQQKIIKPKKIFLMLKKKLQS